MLSLPSRPRRSTRRAPPTLERLEDRTLLAAGISGAVFEDLNGSGLRDAGEPGVAGVVAYLDQNRNDVLDAGEASATTDAAGNYAFSGLAAGTYHVATLVRAGWAQTGPGPAESQAFLGTVLNDFATPQTGSTNYAGLAWANGSLYVVQTGELNTPDGKMYRLDPATGAALGSPVSVPEQVGEITSDGASFWGADFTNNWLIQFDAGGSELRRMAVYDGATQVNTNSAEWDGDSLRVLDRQAQRIYDVNPATGAVLGSIPAPAENVGGLAFDGVHLWVNGRDTDRTYELDAGTGAVVRSFASLGDFAYGLAFDGQALWLSDNRISRIVRYDLGTPQSQAVTLTTADVAGIDFGHFRLGTASGQVYHDLDADGVRDAGEPGLAGWRVFVDANGNGAFDVWEKEALSDASGAYTISGLRPGTHVIAADLRQSGWVRTAPASGNLSVLIRTSGQTAGGKDFGNVLNGLGPVGPETLVNTTTAGTQQAAWWGNRGAAFPNPTQTRSVATAANGDFVVAWESLDASNTWTAFVRLFRADGTARTGEVRVNSITTASGGPADIDPTGFDPTVAMDSTGNFVVAFKGSGAADNSGVYARLFDAAGTPRGAEFLVNTTTTDLQVEPAVAMAPGGSFVVSWALQRTIRAFGSNEAEWDVYAQRFSATGLKQGKEILVHNKSSDPQLLGAIAVDASGNFVVAWQDTTRYVAFGSVTFQRFSAAGSKLGTAVTVDTLGASPSVAFDGSGNFVLAWLRFDGSVVVQRFSASGQALGSALQVGVHAGPPSVAVDQAGNFLITWHSSDGVALDVFARRYLATGAPDGSAFRVNTTPVGDQIDPSVAVTPNGSGFVITWSGNGVGDGSGVFVQRYSTASSLLAAARVSTDSSAPPLAAGVPAALVDEAIRRWAATGLSAQQLELLHSATVTVADLAGDQLGLTLGNTIWIDDNAAGWGWFLDPTPWEDSEFTTPGDQGEQGKMDLLTVLMHEMGHVLGFDHDAEGVMSETLTAGERLSPSDDAHEAPMSPLDRTFTGHADDAWIAGMLDRLSRRS